MSKKSENSSEQDGMNEYVETAGEVKVGKHKPENSSGQYEKNKSIEGKEEMEWLHLSGKRFIVLILIQNVLRHISEFTSVYM